MPYLKYYSTFYLSHKCKNMMFCAAGCSPAGSGAEQQETETTEQPEQQGAPETRAAQGRQPPQSNSTKVTLQGSENSGYTGDWRMS